MYNQEQVLDKIIVFPIRNYLFGLSISSVLKVINISLIESCKLNPLGLVQLGKHMITVLDLPQYLSPEDSTHISDQSSFLLILPDSQGGLHGIPLDEPPDLIELPSQAIRPLPLSHRQSKPALEFVSHVAVTHQKKVATTIFLLDTKQIFGTNHQQNPVFLGNRAG